MGLAVFVLSISLLLSVLTIVGCMLINPIIIIMYRYVDITAFSLTTEKIHCRLLYRKNLKKTFHIKTINHLHNIKATFILRFTP